MIVIIERAIVQKHGFLVLVIDDDPIPINNLKRIKSEKGYNAGIASTVDEAVSLAQKMAYDIIFIDMNLPTINGL
ncbi:MAG: response regulator [Candidatus Hodarchaeales archaeon]